MSQESFTQKQTIKCLRNHGRTKGENWSTENSWSPQQFDSWSSQDGSSVFGFLVILDVVYRYLSLFLFYINIEIGKNRCQMLD